MREGHINLFVFAAVNFSVQKKADILDGVDESQGPVKGGIPTTTFKPCTPPPVSLATAAIFIW